MNRIKKDTSVHQEPNPGERENRENPAWDEEEHVGERKSLILFIVFIVKILLGLKKIAFMNTHLFSCPSWKSEQDVQDSQDSQEEETTSR